MVKVSPVVTQIHPDVSSTFRDTYVLEFFSLPEPFAEKDLQKAISKNNIFPFSRGPKRFFVPTG